MEKGHSHGVPPEGPLRIKWMRMMAKCTMTEATETRPPQAKSDGEPPTMCVKGTGVALLLIRRISAPPGHFG